jgi:antitoxin component YwqK of YwqJK toxin-antitoxin module
MADYNKHLLLLLKRCKIFTKSECYVYKVCCDILSNNDKVSVKWVIVMKKTKNTRTNEARMDVADPRHAKFRANELKVIKIFNKNNPKLTKRFVVNKYKERILKYMVGKVVKIDDYDENIEEVCSKGIHYFKTLETAYYYGDMQKNYTGIWTCWHDNGKKASDGYYVNGKQSGQWICWYDNEKKSTEGCYINGEKTGRWVYWYANGDKMYEDSYVNGVLQIC